MPSTGSFSLALARALLLAGSSILTGLALAQAPPEPACPGLEYRGFDFWLGSWEVRLADGTLAGHNEIASDQGGCVLIERWAGAKGSTGSSQSYYDVAAGEWRQVWISPGVQIDIRGAAGVDEMVLEGTISYVATAETFPFRGRWTLLEDGRVRQFFEEAREPGQWQPWFEGFYTRVAG